MSQASTSNQLKNTFDGQGFLGAVPILNPDEVNKGLEALHTAEAAFGPLNYVSKVHCILESAYRMATHPAALDVVEALLGPDILLFDVTYLIKEPNSPHHVSWHQDLTYWGFDGEEQVSMWLALTPATKESGAMRMIPGSHSAGQLHHDDTTDADNLLYRGQTVQKVDEKSAEFVTLDPGEASFHHGWTLHTSAPNRANHRRIGLNVQYMHPNMKQKINQNETALLVRGEDRYRHFQDDIIPAYDLEPSALEQHRILDKMRKEVWTNAG